ncbi:hypothetical protein GEMRC1_006010 [Eukaryota sp. GEM-RC1]
MEPRSSEDLSQFLTCKRCKHIIAGLNPKVTPCCNHLICEKCVESILKERPIGLINCFCNRTYSKTELLPIPQEVRDLLNNIKFKCPHCDVHFARRELEEHLKTAGAIEISKELCSAGSESIVCVCDHCRQWISREGVDRHLEICPEMETECPNGCGQIFKRRLLHQHYENCLEREITCSASDVGCLYRCKRRDMEFHEKQCPLVAAVTKLTVMESQLRDCRSYCFQLEREKQELEGELFQRRREAKRRSSMPFLATGDTFGMEGLR